MSDRRFDEGSGLIQIAIRIVYCCALTAFISVATFLVIRLVVGTG
jgi:hypothetical protein